MSTGSNPLESAVLRSNIERMNTVRIVVSPSTLNAKGFAASVWRTSNGGSTWERGGTSHADSPRSAEGNARRWLLKPDEDEQATVLTTVNARILQDPRLIGDLLNASLPNPIGSTMRLAA